MARWEGREGKRSTDMSTMTIHLSIGCLLQERGRRLDLDLELQLYVNHNHNHNHIHIQRFRINIT